MEMKHAWAAGGLVGLVVWYVFVFKWPSPLPECHYGPKQGYKFDVNTCRFLGSDLVAPGQDALELCDMLVMLFGIAAASAVSFVMAKALGRSMSEEARSSLFGEAGKD
jgi:hypothetical protein